VKNRDERWIAADRVVGKGDGVGVASSPNLFGLGNATRHILVTLINVTA
jgi:hypothetical protein